ncbi:MAG: hypothetical protein FJ134_14775 [Deltaproteobacteria bacterium]|nr:hypothetical protein [Deltaproteobacteria bacterium]
MGKKLKMHVFCIALAGAVLLPLAAQANLIVNGDFEASPTTFSEEPLSAASYGKWLAGTSWTLGSEANNDFAQYSGTGADLLIQGALLPATSCIGPGWKVKLSFAYQLPPEKTGESVQLACLKPGGAWDLAGNLTNGQVLANITVLNDTNPGEWGIYQTSATLPDSFEALGVGFNLSRVDNVILEVVAPVAFKISPKTLNLKSHGNWVTGFISKPPKCYTLTDINPDTVMLSFGGQSIPADWINSHGRKFMIKFDRQALIAMLNGATGPVTLTVSGAFKDGIAFVGETILNVKDPGKKKKHQEAQSSRGRFPNS